MLRFLGRQAGAEVAEGLVGVADALITYIGLTPEIALSGTALLCFIGLCSCFSMGAFSPLLPEIGRAGALADWQLGVVAGALGFARMAAAIPAGWLAGRYLGTTLCASPALMLAGTALLATSASLAGSVGQRDSKSSTGTGCPSCQPARCSSSSSRLALRT